MSDKIVKEKNIEPKLDEFDEIPWVSIPKLDWLVSLYNVSTDPTWSDIVWWVNWLTFTSIDYNTVWWNSWVITLWDWTELNITAWNSWNITTVTYIYVLYNDESVSVNITETARDSVWVWKILICVAKPTESWKDVDFQAFWTNSKSSFITADNIAANTISADEIATNTITANEIASWAITTDKIIIWAVDNDKISDWAVDDNKINFNYAWASSKWWNANDTDKVNWTSASTVSAWANKANDALNWNSRYKSWLQTSELSSWSDPDTWVIIDSSWIRWFNDWDKNFEINNDWNAYFRWDIWASNIEAWWSIITEAPYSDSTQYVKMEWWELEVKDNKYDRLIEIRWPDFKMTAWWDETLQIFQNTSWDRYASISMSYAWDHKWSIFSESSWLWIWASDETVRVLWKFKLPVWTNLY